MDEFFDNPDLLRVLLTSQKYSGITNPVDGITYKGVSLNIPTVFKEEFIAKIEHLMHGTISKHLVFARLRPENQDKPPHEVHTDKIMGQYTALVYLNPNDQCKGGTAFLEHISGYLSKHPETDEEMALWEADTNDLSKWTKTGYCQMKYNRCLILRSDLLHMAEPISGFGSTPDDARLVLTCFFDIEI